MKLDDPNFRPEFDYAQWPNQPLDGIRAPTNYSLLTESLFLEPARRKAVPLDYVAYTIGEHAVWVPERSVWIPSALQVYIHAIDEYQAMRRLVGSSQQWALLCRHEWFSEPLEVWKAEQDHIQYVFLREQLLGEVEAGTKSAVSAAKTLLDLRKKQNPVGRPRKEKPDEGKLKEDAKLDDDLSRVVGITSKRA